jgi:hypothetical protein
VVVHISVWNQNLLPRSLKSDTVVYFSSLIVYRVLTESFIGGNAYNIETDSCLSFHEFIFVFLHAALQMHWVIACLIA